MTETRTFPPKIIFDSKVVEVTQGKDNRGEPTTLLPDGTSHDLILNYDTPLEKDGKYGPYYIYNVDHQGVTHTMFCNPRQHEAIQNAGGHRGSTVHIQCDREEFTGRDGTQKWAPVWTVTCTAAPNTTVDSFLASEQTQQAAQQATEQLKPTDAPQPQADLLGGDL